MANETNYNIGEEDTVVGRLKSFNDYSNPIARQTGSVAKRIGASRGMGNSSVVVGDSLGAVLQQSVDIAKTDSSNIINTKNQNALNNTNIRNADAGITSNEKIATQSTDTQKQIQQAEAAAQRQNLATELESRERVSTADRNAQATNLATELASREKLSAAELAQQKAIADANAANEAWRNNITHDLGVRQINAQAEADAFSRQHQLLLTNLNNENAIKLESMRSRATGSAKSQDISNNWSQYQQGLAAIDTNASAASQNQQFQRLTDAYAARLDFIETWGVY